MRAAFSSKANGELPHALRSPGGARGENAPGLIGYLPGEPSWSVIVPKS